jgi:hypothetical protein
VAAILGRHINSRLFILAVHVRPQKGDKESAKKKNKKKKNKKENRKKRKADKTEVAHPSVRRKVRLD